MKLQPILILEIYDMVAYKKCLNTEVDVHIRSSSCWNWYKEEARNHNSYDKNVLILFWEEMEIFASFCEARDWTLYWLSWISKVSAFFKKNWSVSNAIMWNVIIGKNIFYLMVLVPMFHWTNVDILNWLWILHHCDMQYYSIIGC